MSKHIKKFETEQAFSQWRQSEDCELPQLSWCVTENAIKSEALIEPPHDYSQDYFTIVSTSDNNTIGWKSSNSYSSYIRTISVSTDNGQTWTSITSSTSGVTLATLNTNDKLLIKGSNYSYAPSSNYNYFTSTDTFNVEGNIMSMLYGDDFGGQTTLPSTRTFYDLFYQNTNIVNAGNLILPATTLTSYCYEYMFYNCTGLTTAPVLPATTLATYCYYYMFCGCTSLNQIICLATDISASNCLTNWVSRVAPTGTFIKDSSMTNWTTGVNGIPSGWTVEDAS